MTTTHGAVIPAAGPGFKSRPVRLPPWKSASINGLHAGQERIFTTLDEAPGTSVKELAALLGITSQLALYHVRRLCGAGRVRIERSGLRFVVFPTGTERRVHQIGSGS